MDREAKMEAAGIKRLDMPEGASLLSMRGGNGLVTPRPGDDVELYVDAGNGKGEWREGYTAISDVEAGDMGDAYDGKDIVWVGKEGDNQAYGDEPLKGMPWPVEFMRLVKGDKPTFAQRGEEDDEEEPTEEQVQMSMRTRADGLLESTVLFFRPDQARNYHGRWIDEGRGNLRSRTPMGQMLDDPIRRENEAELEKAAKMWLEEYNLTPEQIEANITDTYARMTPEQQAEFGSWYYEVHDMAVEWAADLSKSAGKTVRMEQVAGAIAALSPQTGWVGRNDRYADEEDRIVYPQDYADNAATKVMEANQGYAWKVLRVVFERGDTEIEITEEIARDMELGEYTSINYHDYQGSDITPENEHQGFIGKFKYKDLPADILVQLLGENGAKVRGVKNAELGGMMLAQGATAVRLARGAHPDDLRGNENDPYMTSLNGAKVRSFYNNIVNPDESMDSTWDVHMQRAGSNRPDISTTEGANLVNTPGKYQFLHNIMVKAAAKLGIKPHELQAAVWVQWRREQGKKAWEAWQKKNPGKMYMSSKQSAQAKADYDEETWWKRDIRKEWRIANPDGPKNPPSKLVDDEVERRKAARAAARKAAKKAARSAK